MTFPTKGGEWTPDAVRVFRWCQLYPRLDVPAELCKALAWLEANPTRRKTVRGMPKFIVNWLNRATVIQFADALPERPRDRAICPHQPVCGSPGNWQCQQRTVLEQARAPR